MDNDCSSNLKEAIKQHTIEFQLAPPHMHRQNASEQAVVNLQESFHLSILH